MFCLLGSAYTALWHCPSPVVWGWEKSWDGTQPGHLTQTDQRDFCIMSWHLSNESSEKGGRGAFIMVMSVWQVPAMHTEVLLSGKWPHITCWWELENKSHFHLLLQVAFGFVLLNYLYLDPWVSCCGGEWQSNYAST